MAKPLYIKWNDENNLGVPIIDEQHRGWVSLVNTYHFVLLRGKGFEIVNRNRAIVIQHYAEIHFRTEEALMREVGYPGIDKHIDAHKGLMKKIQGTVQEVIATGDPLEALKFLREWWLEHINGVDREFCEYVKISGHVIG